MLSLTREGRPLWWCSSCRDKDALTAALRGQGYAAPPTGRQSPDRPSHAKREAWALAVWQRAQPAAGTLVDRYLAARALPARFARDLRFLPALRHRDTGHLGPVMLAALHDTAGAIRAVHRTWLRDDGSGKAPIEPPRKTLGNPKGCAVQLLPADAALILAEGLETAASACVLFDLPAWACISAGGLAAAIVPDRIRDVVIAADNDGNGTGQRAADTLAKRLVAEGRRVRIAIPDDRGTDFNDVLRARAVSHG